MNRYTKILILLALNICGCNAQQLESESYKKVPIADDILLKDYKPIDVMLFASWHFSYVNADTHKTEEENTIDLTTDQRQKEILDVVSRLKEFEPTIICIENNASNRLDSIYRQYLLGKYELRINEQEQLGFRVAKQLNHNHIYGVDTYSWLRDNYDEVPQLHSLWDEEQKLDTLQENLWNEKYWDWYDTSDTYPKKYTIDEGLKIENHPNNLKRLIGNYLIQLKTKNYNGSDAYSLKIYNRNVRIFSNILKTNPKENDRILVIMGSTHIAFLSQLFDASPEFNLISPYKF